MADTLKSDPAGGLRSWNVCVDHQPGHAGLYRGIRDFARALGGDILSFDGRPLPAEEGSGAPSVRRIMASRGWLGRRVLTIDDAAARAANTVVAKADLLVVHSLFRAHAPWAMEWALRHRRRYWAVPHGCLDPAGLARRSAAKRFWLWRHGRRLFAGADAVVFATRRERDKAAKWIGSATGVVVPWPVEIPPLAAAARDRAEFRARYGIPEHAPILLFVGRLHTTKRLRQLIRAFTAAGADDCHLVIVGMDENLTRADLQAEVQLTSAGRVHVVGELRGERLHEAWLAADGYISLSEKENFGYSAAEALSYGLPVILSPGHDLAYELPTRGDGSLACGWLLPDNALASAVQAIREWTALVAPRVVAPQGLAAMRTTGRSWAADNLSFDTFRDTLRGLAAAEPQRRG
jgi:glycosyltransferase involved in cell wall biosynthesis